jgi:hypothetical protein
MADNPRIRFMANNLAGLNVNARQFSSEQAGFEGVNAFNSFRSSIWRMSGHFLIDSTNDQIYINDGSDLAVSIPQASYTTPTLLAAAIETALNAVSSNWSVSYDLAGGTYKFTISNTGSVTFRLSQTTNSIADAIGYTTTTDLTGLSFVADQQRNHTNEFVTIDFGFQGSVEFIAIISDVDQSFGLSSSAIVTLEGNNIDNFTNPPFSKTLTVNDQGIFEFNDTDPIATFRFWRLNIVDKFNSILGPNLEVGNIYLGGYQTLTGRNITSGFTDTLIDPSKRSQSEGGVLYFDKKTKYKSFSSIPIRLLEDADKQVIKDVFQTVGKTEPFYLSLDPLGQISSDITEFTIFCVFESEPVFTSVGSCFFNTTLNVREVV